MIPAPIAGGSSEVARRGFLDWMRRAFLALWGAGLVAGLLVYIRAPAGARGRSQRLFKGGELAAIPVGAARTLHHPAGPLLLIRVGERDVVALSALCTHVRCVLGWSASQRSIVCPCHGGRFDLAGNPISGPPNRALSQHRVQIVGDEIWIQS
jgi:Rieske Fe-S protein